MKRKNQKGFMLTETLVVSTLIIGVLLFLFIQFRGINQSYNQTFKYNSVGTLYAADALRTFYYDNDFDDIAEYYRTNHLRYLDLTSCPNSVITQTEYCSTLINKTNVKQVIFTDADMQYILPVLGNIPNLTQTMEKYIRSIANDEAGTLLKYRLIVELNDGTFGNIKIGEMVTPSGPEIVWADAVSYINSTYTTCTTVQCALDELFGLYH